MTTATLVAILTLMSGEKELLGQKVEEEIKRSKKIDRLTLLTEYLGETLKRLSSVGHTPREITHAINRVLKKENNPAYPKFVREYDVLVAMRLLKIKPAKGKERLKPPKPKQDLT